MANKADTQTLQKLIDDVEAFARTMEQVEKDSVMCESYIDDGIYNLTKALRIMQQVNGAK